jgi:hypothetical protein
MGVSGMDPWYPMDRRLRAGLDTEVRGKILYLYTNLKFIAITSREIMNTRLQAKFHTN